MRFTPLSPQLMTPRQHAVAEAIQQRGGAGLNGVQQALLHSPEVAERVQLLAEHLRYNLRVPERLRALAILVSAGRYRSADVAHFVGLEEVRDSGLAEAKISALAEGRRPADLKEDEQLVFDFCTELTRTGGVQGATFDRLAGRLGREIALELVAVCGYTRLITNVLNVTQTSFSGRG